VNIFNFQIKKVKKAFFFSKMAVLWSENLVFEVKIPQNHALAAIFTLDRRPWCGNRANVD